MRCLRATLLLLTAVLSLGYAGLGSGKETPPKIEPQAEHILRQMSDFLKAKPRFSFHIDATFEALERGRKLQLSASTQVAVQRPDRLQVAVEGDTLQRQFWYDGASITLLDVDNNNYATALISGGATTTTIDGVRYYAVNGVYYRPYINEGRTVYVVSQP